MDTIDTASVGRCTIQRIDKTIHIRINRVSHWRLRSWLLFANVVFLLPAIWILLQEPLRGLPIILLNIGLWMYYFGRTTFWGLFGQEVVTISRHAISYQRNYGIASTKPRTFVFPSEIRVGFIPDNRYLGPQFGRLAFYTCTGQSNARELILQSAIAIPKVLAPAVQYRILRFFQPALFRPMSMN